MLSVRADYVLSPLQLLLQDQKRSAGISIARQALESRTKITGRHLSVPEISIVEMVFDLILDAMNGFWQLRDAHTEGAITLLPTKVV
jgi:hypothetical protein